MNNPGLGKLFITKNKLLILFIVILIASFLRFYQLGLNPPSLTWDEASWGYNAYSLGIDGRDEFGRFLPITYLESFGDYKPPVYAYLDIIPVKILGLNEFSTRFPSALFGVLTVFVTYFLVKRIFYKSKNSENYALTSALFLAISPWHIMLSRAAFEANVATFFIVFGVWFFLSAAQGRKWYLIFAMISFVLSMYTFNTARIVVPLIILVLTFAFRNHLMRIKKQTISTLFIGTVLLIPLAFFIITPQAGLRFKEVNIFTDIDVIRTSNQKIENDQGAWWSKIVNNRRVLYGKEYARHYLDNLGPIFLFIKGDGNPKFSTQTVGQMYIWDIIFFTAGCFLIFKKREGYWWIIPMWLLIGLIPAGMARETPHALRTEAALPTFQILTAYGFVQLVSLVNKYKKIVILILLGALFINFAYFYKDYLSHYPYDFSGEWQYGYKESIAYAQSQKDKYDYIQITDDLGRPYIYYLFYSKTPPEDFRKTAKTKRDNFGFVKVLSFDKYLFPENYISPSGEDKKILYINTHYNLPIGSSKLKTFYLLNGQPMLTAYAYD